MSKTVKKAKRLSAFAKISDIDSKHVLVDFSRAFRVLKTRPAESYAKVAGQDYAVVAVGKDNYVVPFTVLADVRAKAVKALRSALAYRGLRVGTVQFS